LLVAEALITPNLSSRAAIESDIANPAEERPLQILQVNEECAEDQPSGEATTEQLRITLTGPTTSGKSSLLGTLSTATLDNGRGKSRLSLLKHRHEIASGVTSSVAQELIGYKNDEVSLFLRI
jgi:GTPase